MCSYNEVNETYACESESVMNALLKNELDFQGYVVSGKWTLLLLDLFLLQMRFMVLQTGQRNIPRREVRILEW